MALGWQGIYVLCVLAVMLIVLAKEWAPADFTLLLVVFLFVPPEIILVRDAVQGFSNEGVLTVACLFAAAAGIHKTGALDLLFTQILGQPRSLRSALWRLCVPVAFASSFLNNTPIVAMMIPVVQDWCARTGLDPKGLLMPLSFATILGGTNTIIGTSTNLVITGQLEAYYEKNKKKLKNPDDYKISLFELAPYGVSMSAGGIIAIMVFAQYFLVKRDKKKGVNTGDSKFLYRVQVLPHSRSVNKTVHQSGLRGMGDLYLASVQRNGKILVASPEFVLLAGDILELVGDPTELPNLIKKHALAPIVDDDEAIVDSINGRSSYVGTLSTDLEGNGLASMDTAARYRLNLLVLRVKPEAPVIGKSVKEASFRSTFFSAVISIRRAKESLSSLGGTVLQAGDELLVDADALLFNPLASPIHENFEVLSSAMTKSKVEFAITMQITSDSPFIGKSVKASKLRGLYSLFLVAVENETFGEVIDAVGPDYVFREGDILFFAGDAKEVPKLRNFAGLAPYRGQADKIKVAEDDRHLVQVVLSTRSNLNGKTVKEIKFRTRFDAVVLGITHNGERVKNKIGDLVLNAGDVLLLEAGPEFMAKHKTDPAFGLVLPLDRIVNGKQPLWRAAVAVIAIGLAIGLAAFEKQPLIVLIIFAITVMILTKCYTTKEARDAVNWEVIIAVAAAFGISNAMTKSGLADWIGDGMVKVAKGISGGDEAKLFPMVLSLFICTVLLSEILTNNAAAALVFPIAISTVQSTGLPVKIIMFTIMLAASDYATPFGYQTNLMVYSAGGYNFMDFVKFGGIIQIITGIVSIKVLSLYKIWYVFWIIYLGILAAFIAYVELGDVVKARLEERRRQRGGGGVEPLPSNRTSEGSAPLKQ